MDVYSATITHKRMGRVIIDVVTLADHEQALAEKDREIEAKDTELGKLDAELIVSGASYRQLMEKAVLFATWLRQSMDNEADEAQDADAFLKSPAVKAWKEQT